ncbi:N-acetylglucosamine-6-phosphate deacetylase [Streptococcus cuniculipharyngis]|uniref:N-acetylglucosamine-6-phosphate deacetylase n=1 Tax=Streptococcus cuniculipharyngis TaxID=1562651 RepID=A0A5C5SDT5_9STRE|nr:N-acetylglucosamine-6-phosphate deacetylase [Streptococcus cuniculipharyngis]TWS99116.1 N-acetylglucosamine-6-phosphate deacetylase [Streptococcus cuniculipharyngis]
MTSYLYAKRFYYLNEEKEAGYLPILEDGRFGDYQKEKPTDGQIIDYGNFSIAPGLVDTHIHGFMGHDVMDASAEGLEKISEHLPSCGVTSYLPTTLTAAKEELDKVCQLIGQVAPHAKGAKMQGIFLEGPFFTETYKGAQNPSYMGDPDKTQLDQWQELSQGLVRKIALAPERQGAVDFIQHAKREGIYTALAHTDATYDQCQAAVEAGANIFVHTYNGMRGLHHREPGVVGAALTLGQFNELICDGHHVHPVSAKIVKEMSAPDRLVLITDCMRAGGLGDCQSKLGEFDVEVKNGAARLTSNGSLAGSVLELMTAVQNVIKWGLASPAQALQMASYNPALSVGLEKVCGQLAAGHPADFIVLDDDFNLQATYINGQAHYEK